MELRDNCFNRVSDCRSHDDSRVRSGILATRTRRRLGVDLMPASQHPQALLTMLYRHSAPFPSLDKNAPSNAGAKHLMQQSIQSCKRAVVYADFVTYVTGTAKNDSTVEPHSLLLLSRQTGFSRPVLRSIDQKSATLRFAIKDEEFGSHPLSLE